MCIFRSEEHIDHWCRANKRARGGTMTVPQQWQLARAWHAEDRRLPHWRRKTIDEAESVFSSIGLTGDFWRLR